MTARYPAIAPYDSGMLDVGDGNHIHWETSGNPDGKPAVCLHGGPGSGSSPGARRYFDPARYRIVQFDQRGCGRSTPDAGDPATDMSVNTTAHLISDIERLREHLGIDRWLVFGGSWGSTLGIAYAQRHPDRVSEIVMVSVVATTRAEVDWVTRRMGRIFPAQWERFRDTLPETDRDGDLAAGYARMLADPDPAVRDRAAREWCTWEDTHVATYAGYQPDPRYDDPVFRYRWARIVTHYWANAAWLSETALFDGAHRLAGIPGVLVNGQLDISGPPDIAWRLTKEWPDAELVLIPQAGHGTGDLDTATALVTALDRFAGR
ncbi:proline iminopeptidase [Stackebrandtia albiflava]|uniref:Proline iminopeptidase n=1 Tax=Stackebrandtia albiflava TaxID=406432 RepID=A0A562V4Q1_9ACTN|nr:prolyl aminopeptidase [Stackebrandtia albiflava]TWJ12866.1 proline iminopeptidase [Stackebrandtia albiflava]